MYVPAAFREERLTVLHDLVRANSFGALVSAGASGLFATHIPFLLDAERGEHGTLVAHVARANPQWREIDGREVLVIFAGPHSYISPRWYESTAAVPTWNYAAVHAYGTVRLLTEPAALWAIVERTVATYEAGFDVPWTLAGARAYAEKLLNGIVGFEIPIDRLEGKLKLSQNRPTADRRAVVAALREAGQPDGAAVADLMERHVALD